jgi:hypothetical protein
MTNISKQLTNNIPFSGPSSQALSDSFIDKLRLWALRAPGQGLRPSAYLNFFSSKKMSSVCIRNELKCFWASLY